ncbi:hypothetical protein SeMB42_g02850 [Synchytrium endobioticum]|uniref:RRM domain-containing protein n=1 Tax=Synchytrium endobioticum TaxID=286115 RepID=A0A507DBG4_9FUNG|nr:hypothetical protein SeLEV6574_g06794 [Synchytrium endobioticum]TPX48826.1 hypothetical protein SeMB42_g02850 [Synchytrium endobioticum]
MTKRSPSPIAEDDTSAAASKKARIINEDLEMADNVASAKANESPPCEPPNNTDNQPTSTIKLKKLQLYLQHLPKDINGVDIRKLCEDVSIKFTRFKKAPHWEFAFLDFNTPEERDHAIQRLDGHSYKGKSLKACMPVEKPPKEPNRNVQHSNSKKNPKKVKGRKNDDSFNNDNDDRTALEKLADQTTPLWRVSYDDQLKEKTKDMAQVFLDFKKQLLATVDLENGKSLPQDLSWIRQEDGSGGLPCSLLPIVPSPVIDGYRNKCEFSMGLSPDGEETVGFLLGLFKDGVVQVMGADHLKHVSDTAKKVASGMQKFIQESEFVVYDREAKKGFWRLMLVRTPRSGDVMVLVQYNSEGLDKDAVEQEKKRMKDWFETCAKNGEFPLTTVVLQDCNDVFHGLKDAYPTEVIIGNGEIHEEMLNLRFRISPFSFFQVNTPATELLYSTVREWCRLSEADTTLPESGATRDKPKRILLDLCCGTGTIGITMASQVDRVLGIEITASAVQDAEKNAMANGISNTIFIADKVENAIQNVIKKYCLPPTMASVKEDLGKANDPITLDGPSEACTTTIEVIAVLDPPRAGVHHKVISAVRECDLIDRVIFVACDAGKSIVNWIDLCKPSASGRKITRPFKLVRAQPFDLFPHTRHTELVLEFVRNQIMVEKG